MQKILLDCQTNNLDEFRMAAELAKDCGMTHVLVSQIEKSMWQWNKDRYDPYPNWGMGQTTLFKIVVPEALKKYLPSDYAERNLETIIKRVEILKEYGLSAALKSTEPSWLPLEVYAEHPSWRGPRCDQPRRARKEYYSPCTDNPEVAALYDEAVYKLCSVAQIELFDFLTNDSGGGLCWSERLYPGANGPSRCHHISTADRAVNFLNVIQNAAARAGINAEVGYTRFFLESEKAAIVSKLNENQFCCGARKDGSFVNKRVGFISNTLTDPHNPTVPVNGIPLVVKIATDMQQTAGDTESNIFYVLPTIQQKEYNQFLRLATGKIKNSTSSRYEILKQTAVSIIGETWADKLLDVWENIDTVQKKLVHLNQGGHMFTLGTVHQRWLTRPLVAFPNELTNQEKSYYREFIFQAESEKEADNLLNLQATYWLSGHSARGLLMKCTLSAMEELDKAISILKELLSQPELEAHYDYLSELLLKLRMYVCVIKNAQNVVQFQSILDRTDYEAELKDTSVANDEQGDVRLYKILNIVRAEIDNSYEMIGILDQAKTPVLLVTESEESEDIMTLGPDVKNDLYKKIEIMEKHRYDFNRLYKCTNM